MAVRVQQAAFDIATELVDFGQDAGVGGIVTFSGIVRDLPGGGLKAMEIEHYPGMTERAIAKIVAEATTRWELVATAAAHRAEAFAAAEFLMDYLKSRAPFWKKEITDAGAEWVDAKDEDEAALGRW